MRPALVPLALLLVTATADAAPPASAVEGVARAHLLGARPELGRADLRLDRVEPWGMGRFRRHHRGVPVLGGEVVVRVDDAGRVLYDGADRGVVQADLSVSPDVDAATAIRVASGGAGDEARAARLRVLALPGRRARLVWEVILPPDWRQQRFWRVLVDAHDGAVVYRQDLLKRAGRAKVFPGGTPLDGDPIEVTLNLPAGAQRLANADFIAYNCIDRGTCPLRARNTDWRFCEIEPKAKADANGDFLYDRPASDADPEDEFAEVQMFYQADVTMQKFRSLGVDRLAGVPINTYVNIRFPPPAESTCLAGGRLEPFENAFYFSGAGEVYAGWPTTAALVFGQGATVDNAYEGDTIYHELSHALQQRLYGATLFDHFLGEWGLSIDGGSMGEGTADYFAAAITDDPVVFEYSLPVQFQRDLSDKRRCPQDIAGEVHEDSKILSSALWTARTALPEAERDVLDRALVQAMAGFVDTDGYPDYARKVIAEMRGLAGDGPADLVAAKLAEHGLDDCSGYVADLAPGAAWPVLFMSTYGEDRAPAPVQWRVTLPQAFDHLVITIDDANGELPRGTMVIASKIGDEPLRWDPDTALSDGRPETAVGLTGARSSIVPGPFPAGPVVLQLVLARPLNGLYVMSRIRFRGENAPVVVDAGTSGGGDDGGGCASGGATAGAGAAWLLLALLARLAARRYGSR